jgi:long-chain fatty acid transport protein
MRLIGIGPNQEALAGAGCALALDAHWLAVNPAAMIELPRQAEVSASLIRPTSTLDAHGPGSPAFGGAPLADPAGRQEARSWIGTGAAALVQPTRHGLWSLGVYSVAGVRVSYGASRTTLGGFDHSDSLEVERASLAYARTCGGGLTAAVALDVDWQHFRSDALTGRLTETAGAGQGATSWGGGFLVALHQRVGPLAWGASYTSRQWMQPFKPYRDLFVGTLDQPPVAQVGVAWHTSWGAALADYRYIDWDEVRQFRDSSAGFGWRNQNIFKVGADLNVAPGWAVRAGVSYGRSPIPESQVFVNALTGLVSEWNTGVGVAGAFGPDRVAVSWLHSFKHSETDDGGDVHGLGRGTTVSLAVDAVTAGYGLVF